MSTQVKAERARVKRAERTVGTSGGGVVANPKGAAGAGSVNDIGLGVDLETMRGRVAGYTVGSNGLVVHLDVAAHIRIAFHVDPDEPHFRSAVSLTMVALNNRINPATVSASDQQYLWVSLDPSTTNRKLRRATKVAMSFSNEKDPFDLDGWVST